MARDNFDIENNEPVDINGFIEAFRTAWTLTPELRFDEAIDTIFNGYNLSQLNNSEMLELMDEFILQNQ